MTMLADPSAKYRPFPPVALPDRQWPSRTITRAPIWLSTDLRDGNQALIDPMDGAAKRRLFDLLCRIGLKEIEIGFPAAGATDFDFCRALVDGEAIPDGVTVQALTPARPELIAQTFDALDGAPTAIVHLYNAVSPLWRRVVFDMTVAEVTEVAVAGARRLVAEAARRPATRWRFQYSPECFSTAEPEVSVTVCAAVMDALGASADDPVILNLPATVEAATPNVHADQIEWFCRNLPRREAAVISLHTHNDRGTGVAAAELGLLAGADRVEGCLFGNGERTGNACLVTLALNLYTQGVAPGIDLSDIDQVIATVEHCTGLPVPARHPYGGALVHTAFSGSHQDAIRKGFAAREGRNEPLWEVPYLPIDPADIGRSYEAVIRVNSQSGKGGVAWVLEQDHGYRLPRALQMDFAPHVQALADASSQELTSAVIADLFERTYLRPHAARWRLGDWSDDAVAGGRRFRATVTGPDGVEQIVTGIGNGLLSAAVAALAAAGAPAIDIADYSEHAIGEGSGVDAVAYVRATVADGRTVHGVGRDADAAAAGVRALLSAINRL